MNSKEVVKIGHFAQVLFQPLQLFPLASSLRIIYNIITEFLHCMQRLFFVPLSLDLNTKNPLN